MKALIVSILLAVFVTACAPSPDKRVKDKLNMVSGQPDRKYCTGEHHGKFREVTNREVIPYIIANRRFPQLCRQFFAWEDAQKEKARYQSEQEAPQQ